MSDIDPRIWTLPERLTIDTVGALFRARAEQPGAIRGFDLSQVREIDTAGVALMHWFRDQQQALGLVPATISGISSERYRALCQAHRIKDMAGLSS